MKPYLFETAIFDMDGVITKTARVHAAAWKLVFDEYLRLREKRDKEPFREFTHQEDYLTYVDGKPRLKGIQSFLESRGIHLPAGNSDDAPEAETIYGLGNKKNAKFCGVLNTGGVEVYEPAVELIKKFRKAGIKVGVVSSSKNCEFVLQSAGVLDLFDTRVDGVIAEELGLKGKPDGDIFCTAVFNLSGMPGKSIVFEDAVSGVQAGQRSGFGLVVGVARSDNVEDLNKSGADVVVTRLDYLDLEWIQEWFSKKPPDLFKAWDKPEIIQEAYASFTSSRAKVSLNPVFMRTPKSVFDGKKKVTFFLDYDGTLTPIVARPDLAVLSAQMRDVLRRLCVKFKVAVVSGRMRDEVEKLVAIKEIVYAGSHGFDIRGAGIEMVEPKAKEAMPLVEKTLRTIKESLGDIPGMLIEEKKFSIAVHYRQVSIEADIAQIKRTVENAVAEEAGLRLIEGKKVFEILPAIDWNKGKAVQWIMKALNLSWEDNAIVYIGDDTTDEDAFRVLSSKGMGILVAESPRASAAHFCLSSPDEVEKLFERLLK
ncbi:MAG: trehalose-phosphatase [Candidatus Omnitrophica bacterium]|nr:trehalose-phosphatase [Candidatus Omnitrophota bacterium]